MNLEREFAMPLNERIYKIEQLLKNRSVVPFDLMKERTEASRATLTLDSRRSHRNTL